IPVIERHERTDADRKERVDEGVVEVEALLVDPAAPARQHARPADRVAVRAEAELAHERHVLSPAVVVIARDVAGLAGRDRAGHAAERVPDRRPLAVLGRGALDLVRRRRGAPQEARRETSREVRGHRRASASSHTSPMRALMPPSTYSSWPVT